MRFKSHGLIYQMRLPCLTNWVTWRINFLILHVTMRIVRVSFFGIWVFLYLFTEKLKSETWTRKFIFGAPWLPAGPGCSKLKVDSTIHRIILYPLDSAIGFPNIYPMDSTIHRIILYLLDSAIGFPNTYPMDSTIHRINLYPMDSAIGFPNTYPMDSTIHRIILYLLDSAIGFPNMYQLDSDSSCG